MQGFQAIFVVSLAFIIGVNCVNLENSTSSVNGTISRADEKCIQKCGKDPSIMCIGNLTSDRNIICSCKEETEAYDEKSRQCLDRCTVKCGTHFDGTCEGDQSSDENTICSCKDKKNVYRNGSCWPRCYLKCGIAAACSGDQTSDDTTICNCWLGYFYNEETGKCEGRCKVKCGDAPYVTCTGSMTSEETTICGCKIKNLSFDEKNKTCIKRCTKKCGWDSNIKCEGNQTTDETTICGCRNPSRSVYDKKSQTCKVKCDCENGICEEDENGIAICRCLPEYGRVSDVRCEECGCGKGANCTFESSTRGKKCLCRESYSEVNGTCKGDCSGSPCKNGGTCRIEADDIICNCMRDYSGEYCEERDKCVQKCGKDPGVMCVGDLTLAKNIICSCRDETETYDERSQQCIDRCVQKCGDDLTVKCEGDQKTAETTICSCKNKTHAYSSYGRKCKGRCEVKCGIHSDIRCEGDQTSDETTICGCANKKYEFRNGYCFPRCFLKCNSLSCKGDQTSDNTTICDCRYGDVYNEKSGKCEDRCKVKCGNSVYVTCNKKSDKTTICGCNRKDRVFHEKSLTCIKRCTNKCGWDPNIKCEGDQTTDETTICGCRDTNRFYDVESQTCKVKCDCENGICDEDVNGIAICRCLPSYGRVSNIRCEECGCGKGANCTFEGSSKKKNCICRKGYSVINGVCKGDCSNSPCKNGGICRIVADDITCDCRQPFTGEYCEEIDHCASNPCKNGGTCRSGEDTFECTCGEIYGGKDCSKNTWCDKNGKNLCGKEKCLYNETLGKGYCVCENGRIFDEPSKTCMSVHCVSHPCINGGTCTDDGDTFKCTCPEYYGGKDCSENKVCDIYGKYICGNEKCIVDEEQAELNCICEDGKVFDWLSKKCGVNQCASNPCKNGGSCINQGNTYKCTCSKTYSGRDCSENIWCFWNGKMTCGEALCDYDDVSGKASCICPSNEEFDKTSKTCKGVCEPNLCVHGACFNDGKKHSFCKCFGSYTGIFCNETVTDPCTPNPCQNGGSCMVTYGSEFKCICRILNSGSTCEYGNKTVIIMLLAALGASVLTIVCCGVFCWKKNQKLKKMSSSTGIHQAPQTVISPESLQNNVYPSAPRF